MKSVELRQKNNVVLKAYDIPVDLNKDFVLIIKKMKLKNPSITEISIIREMIRKFNKKNLTILG